MDFFVTLRAVSNGTTIETGAARHNQAQYSGSLIDIQKSQSGIQLTLAGASEAQMNGILGYLKAVSRAVDTSSIETAIDAII